MLATKQKPKRLPRKKSQEQRPLTIASFSG